MALEVKTLLKELGLPEDLSEKEITDFNAAFNGKGWINKSVAHQDDELRSSIIGKFAGSVETAAIRAFGIKKEDVKEKKLEEIIEFGASSLKSRLKELEERGSGNNEEEYKKLEKKHQDLVGKYSQLEGMNKELSGTLEKTTSEYEGKLKGVKINTALTGIKASIPFIDEDSPMVKAAKKGFEAHIAENFQFDLDDKETLIVKDKDGKQIEKANKGGFLGVEDVLKREAEAFKLLKMNNAKPGGQNNNNQRKLPDGKIPTRELPAAAIANANRT